MTVEETKPTPEKEPTKPHAKRRRPKETPTQTARKNDPNQLNVDELKMILGTLDNLTYNGKPEVLEVALVQHRSVVKKLKAQLAKFPEKDK